jgi:hypothetical protein
MWIPAASLFFVLLQHPVSACTLLHLLSLRAWKHAPATKAAGPPWLACCKTIWAGIVLSATLWLLDLAAISILHGGATFRNPFDMLQLALPCLQWASFSEQLPAVKALLQPNVQEDEKPVWADNYILARLAQVGVLESFPIIVLQLIGRRLYVSTYTLPSFMLSVALSSISFINWLLFRQKMRRITGRRYGAEEALQMQGSFRVAAGLLDAPQPQNNNAGTFAITLPPAALLTPLQHAGFIDVKLTKRKAGDPEAQAHCLQISNLRTAMKLRPDDRDALGLDLGELLLNAKKHFQLGGFTSLDLRNCDFAR